MRTWPALVLYVAVVGAQAQSQSPPVIRVTTRLVEVNAIVRDKSGPVRGLTKDDFTVFDRGKAQAIVFFSANSLHTVETAAERPLPANTFTNRREPRGGSPTTATIILLDGVNTLIRDQIWVKKQFTAFLSQIQPQERFN